MKTVVYMGKSFNVDEGAKFIAADKCGEVYAYSEQPWYDGDTWWKPSESEQWSVGTVYFDPQCEAI